MISFKMQSGRRCYTPDSDHAEIAKWLRSQATTGFCKDPGLATWSYGYSCSCGVNLALAPNSTSLILTRDDVDGEPKGWHLSVCCVTDSGYRNYSPLEGEHWRKLVFGEYASRVVEDAPETSIGQSRGVRHFRLACDWEDQSDPATTLRGLELAE